MSEQFEVRRIYTNDPAERSELLTFLGHEGLDLDQYIDYSVGVFEGNELVATGSCYINTLRCLAVKSTHQGLGLMNKVVSHLQEHLFRKGYGHLFLYTKPELVKLFEDLGFYEIAVVSNLVIFMENRADGIGRFTANLAGQKVPAQQVAAIVMNANPFTLGHQYLVEKAAKENDHVHVFVVEEEASVIPFAVRKQLIQLGTAHLANVTVHDAGPYMVSKATFPSYFLQDESLVVKAHAKLDLEIFLRHIVPALGITVRYVGDEPYCRVTRTYIETMKKVLEARGVRCEIVPRLDHEAISKMLGTQGQAAAPQAISASAVRKLIREDQLEAIKAIVPKTTYDFFSSEAGKSVIEGIKARTGRH